MSWRKHITTLLVLILGPTSLVLAAETHPLLSDDEIEIHNKAKHRTYPGGQDEDSLKVQTQLPVNLSRSNKISASESNDAAEEE